MKPTNNSTHPKKLGMRTAIRTQPVLTLAALAALGCAMLGLTAASLSAQTELLAIEFSEDDQEGFELWPEPLRGLSTSTASFPTDPSATSGSTTLTMTANTSFGLPAPNRGGTMDGTPVGYSYQHLYEDLLIASSPTGFLTLDFSGLNPNQTYRFTLYAWDPGDNGGTSAPVKEWTVTGGTGDPSVATIDFRNPLLNNESFAMVFDITTTETGTFQLINTDGLPQSAINGFKLTHLAVAEPFNLLVTQNGLDLEFAWESEAGMLYNLLSSADLAADLATWDLVAGDLPATPPSNMMSITRPGDLTRFYRVEEFPAPPVTIFSENFDGADPGWTTGFDAADLAMNTGWQLGTPVGGAVTGPPAAQSGANCYGTNLAANYGISSNTWLRSPAIDLSTATAATVVFQHWVDMDEFDNQDHGTVRVLEAFGLPGTVMELAVVQTDITGLAPVAGSWVEFSAELPAAALGQSVVLEFVFVSDDDDIFDASGWYLDGVMVTTPAP